MLNHRMEMDSLFEPRDCLRHAAIFDEPPLAVYCHSERLTTGVVCWKPITYLADASQIGFKSGVDLRNFQQRILRGHRVLPPFRRIFNSIHQSCKKVTFFPFYTVAIHFPSGVGENYVVDEPAFCIPKRDRFLFHFAELLMNTTLFLTLLIFTD